MLCLTVHQPYAHLFFLHETDEDWKGVENRDWPTDVRGTILIHAGLSDKSMTVDYALRYPDLPKGAIVGCVDIVDCFKMGEGVHHEPNDNADDTDIPEAICRKYEWIENHPHVYGPYCFVFKNPRRFLEPIPYRGMQKFYHVEDALVRDAIATAVRDTFDEEDDCA
jgi:hypothetical protein